MALSKIPVKHVAKLANLPLSEKEEEKYGEQLSKILDYVETLNQVDTEGVEPTFNVSGKSNVLAKDEVGESLSQEDVTKNGSNTKDGYFVTKGVFNE